MVHFLGRGTTTVRPDGEDTPELNECLLVLNERQATNQVTVRDSILRPSCIDTCS